MALSSLCPAEAFSLGSGDLAVAWPHASCPLHALAWDRAAGPGEEVRRATFLNWLGQAERGRLTGLPEGPASGPLPSLPCAGDSAMLLLAPDPCQDPLHSTLLPSSQHRGPSVFWLAWCSDSGPGKVLWCVRVWPACAG